MRWSVLLLAVALLIPGLAEPAQAQEERECECPPAGRLRVYTDSEGPHVVWMGQRARLGVRVHAEANPDTDRYGALIDGVAKGSPADKAGLKKGDIITKLNGESLLSGGGVYEEDESAPGMRLIERARQLERGDTVEVEFRRDGETKTVELVAGAFDEMFFEWSDFADEFGEPRRLRRLMERYRELPEVHIRGPETFALRLGTRLPGLELVSLNPGLGEYFGTAEGLLVVRAPKSDAFELQDGDVIQTIDGREPKDVRHAMRILSSYQGGESLRLGIMRDKKKRTLDVEIPADQRGMLLDELSQIRPAHGAMPRGHARDRTDSEDT